jgi:hypothetical protein
VSSEWWAAKINPSLGGAGGGRNGGLKCIRRDTTFGTLQEHSLCFFSSACLHLLTVTLPSPSSPDTRPPRPTQVACLAPCVDPRPINPHHQIPPPHSGRWCRIWRRCMRSPSASSST